VLPIVVVVAIGLGSTAVMAGVILALIRSLKVLSGSLAKFRDDVQPLLDEVRKGTEHSQDVLERISSRQLSKRPGGKLRR
jgi:hypothetical protein